MADAYPRSGLPFAAVILAVLIGGTLGGVLGFAAHAMFAKPQQVKIEPQIVQKELSPEELAQLCEPQFKDERKTLIDAQAKVKSLQSDIDSKEKELAQYKADADKNAANRDAAIKRWKAKEAEIADLKSQLGEATQQRDQLMTQLQDTIRDLNTEIVARKKAEALADHFQTESTDNAWTAFNSGAKVDICEKGTRKKHEKCDDAVDAALTPDLKAKFVTCVNSYQAVPVLKRLEKKSDTLPQYGVRLPDDKNFTDTGWYINFCDPTLPEAGANPNAGDEPSVDVDGTTAKTKPALGDDSTGDGSTGTPAPTGTSTPAPTTPSPGNTAPDPGAH